MKKVWLRVLICIMILSSIGYCTRKINGVFEPKKLASTTVSKELKNVDGVSINKNIKNENLRMFDKYTEIFGIKLYATKGVTDEKLAYATKIMAGYLDNDSDGKVDNKLVVDKMVENNATMIVFKTSEESEKITSKYEKEFYSLMKNNFILQDLYDSEIHPAGSKYGVFDASLEELLHLITHAGYAYAYPEVFGEKKGTQVANAMDIARGGYFETVPEKYPESAWYSYYDETADYSTMITEYMYWSLTSILCAQKFEGRLDEIKNEWKLNTKEKVMHQDPKIYELLKNKKYKFPKVLPDGKYDVSKIS